MERRTTADTYWRAQATVLPGSERPEAYDRVNERHMGIVGGSEEALHCSLHADWMLH